MHLSKKMGVVLFLGLLIISFIFPSPTPPSMVEEGMTQTLLSFPFTNSDLSESTSCLVEVRLISFLTGCTNSDLTCKIKDFVLPRILSFSTLLKLKTIRTFCVSLKDSKVSISFLCLLLHFFRTRV